MKYLERFLKTWVAWVLSRPRFVVGVCVALAVASLWLAATRLKVSTDQLSLISKDHPLIELSEKLDPFDFRGKTAFTVVIESPTPERAVAFAKDLEKRLLEDKGSFQAVFYRIDPNLIKRWALLYLDKEEILKIRESLEENSGLIDGFSRNPDVLSFFKLINQEMASRMVGELFTGFLDEKPAGEESGKKDEPMDLGVLIQTLDGLSSHLKGAREYFSPWASFFEGSEWNLDLEGYFWEADKSLLVMSVVPRKVAKGFSSELNRLGNLREHIREARASFGDVRVGVTGQEALNTDEMMTVFSDMHKATWLSLLGVFVLMVLFLRGFRRPLMQSVSLAVGLCWTLGWATVFIGHLNILSIVFAPLLCGLGVDYGIHWFARMEEEETKNRVSIDTVIRRVVERSGPGIFLAGIGTSCSLLPFVLTGFRGLMELGLITGTGILLQVFSDFTVTPALIGIIEGRRAKKAQPSERPEKGDVLRLTPRTAGAVLAGVAVVALFSFQSARKVGFDLNPLRLQAANAEAVVWEKLLLEKSKRSPLSAAVFASSPEEVAEKSALIKSLPSVSEVETLFTFLPKDQESKIPLLRSLVPLLPVIHSSVDPSARLDAGELAETLERIRFKMQDEQAEKWGAARPMVDQISRVRGLAGEVVTLLRSPSFDRQALQEYAERFRKDLLVTWDFLREGASASRMFPEDIPEDLKGRFFHDGQYLLRVYPKESVWEEGALTRFVQDLQRVDPQVVGDPVSLYVFASAFKQACIDASLYAVVCIFALMLLTFRSLPMALLGLVPLVLGSLFTIGVMGLAGIQFNLANSIFMPLVVGAGVEYAVIILNRWREGRMCPGHLPFSTGKGLLLASLTTTLGFGTLMISQHRGIFSLGFVAWEGSLCVVLSAMIVLPAILAGMRQPTAVPDKEEMDALKSNVLGPGDPSLVTCVCSTDACGNRRGLGGS